MSPADLSLLAPLVGIGLLAFVARIVGRSWLAPVAFLPLCWTAYLAIAVLLAGRFPLHAAGLWMIVSMVLAFVVGGMFVTRPSTGPSVSEPALPVRAVVSQHVSTKVFWATAAFSILATLGVVGMFRGGVASFGLSSAPQALLLLGREFSVARYGGGAVELPAAVSLLLYWAFPASVLGGMVFALARRRTTRLLGMFPLVLAFASGLITASRAGILMSGVMWTSAVLAVSVVRERGTGHLFRARWAAAGMAAVLLLVAIYALLQWVRGGVGESFDVFALGFSAIETFLGSISVFTQWFAVAEPGHPSWGAFTFAGPFDLFQLAERKQGLYETTVYFASGSGSNIYTAFRGLIEDFGYAGAWLVCFGLGAGSAVAYRKCGEGLITWVVPLSVFYSLSLFSHLYSMFMNNSVIVGWLIAMLVLILPESQRGQVGQLAAKNA